MAEENNVSRVGDVRPHPTTGFRQVLTQRGKHTRWIDTPEQAGPTQVLHNGFAKDPATLSPQEMDEVRAQTKARSAESAKPVSVMGTGAPKVKEPSITERAKDAGQPLKKQKDIARDVDGHIDALSAHITSLKSHLSGLDLPEDHPAVRAVDDASDHVAAATLIMHGDDKDSFDYNKRPNAEAVAAGRENPRENKTEAEQALTSAAAAVAHAHRKLSSKDVLSVEGTTTPAGVSAKDVADNHEHAKTFHIFGFKGSRAGHVNIAGTTLYGNDPGVQGAVARIRRGKANGEYQAVNLPALIRSLRGTKRFTAGQLAEQGVTREQAQKSVEWNGSDRKEGMSLGAAAIMPSGARPWSGREGSLGENAGDAAPRSGMARPVGAVRAETVGEAQTAGEAVREQGSAGRRGRNRQASLEAFRSSAGPEKVRASQNAGENARFQADQDRQAAIENESEKLLKRQGQAGNAPKTANNAGVSKALKKVKGNNGK